MTEFWMETARNGPSSARIGGTEVGRGSRVRLRPRAGGDAHDLFLTGRIAVVEAIDEDGDGALHLSVTLEDDPGRDLGETRFPGHRFFFSPAEVEPLDDDISPARPTILVAGIGNIFLGDDGFGVEVVRRLAADALPAGVEVVDFGIRGMDLAYALQKPYAAVVMVDAAPRGGAAGTLYVIEPDDGGDSPAELATHAMDPVRVLRLARTLGGTPPR
ncbi:MAG TPA: hydrogenase maturation protease, partial [Longimicrobium sp.]|nr:hydrogenase maturation protease [Longimicrobium sp.]